ncbi:hypothetical protein GPALN_011176 [Globodera pallida]|nr:hypothetical protein GPALN_011176 [Globodera pallida]
MPSSVDLRRDRGAQVEIGREERQMTAPGGMEGIKGLMEVRKPKPQNNGGKSHPREVKDAISKGMQIGQWGPTKAVVLATIPKIAHSRLRFLINPSSAARHKHRRVVEAKNGWEASQQGEGMAECLNSQRPLEGETQRSA